MMASTQRAGVAAAAIALAVVGLAVAVGGAQSATVLTAGATSAGDLKGGEIREFELDLVAGEYLAVSIDQRGIDVRPVVLAPDGSKVFDLDTREFGIEPVEMVAQSSGRYRLQLKPLLKDLPRGRYELHVDAIRPATATDIARAEARALQVAGYAAIADRTPDGLHRARTLYETMRQQWHALGDRIAEADALTALSFVANWLDDFRGEADAERQDVELRREAGDEYGEARALSNLGRTLNALGEVPDAIDAYTQSLALHRAAGRVVWESQVLAQMALAERQAGDYDGALAHAYDAVRLARETGDREREVRALMSVAAIHVDLREFDVAIGLYERVRTIAIDDTWPTQAATIIGTASIELGDYARAERLLTDSLAVWTARKWRGYEARTLTSLGELYARRGDFERARDAFDRAAAKSAEDGYAAGEVVARRRAGEMLVRLGNWNAAAAALGAAEALVGRSQDPIGAAFVQAAEARLALAQRQLDAAESRARGALEIVESVRGRADNVRIRASLLSSTQTVYETLVDVLMAEQAAAPAASYDARALEISERARARSLFELVLAERPSAGEAGPLESLRRIERRIDGKAQALDAARRAKNLALAAALSGQIDELSDQLGLEAAAARRGRGDPVAFAEPLSMEALQHQALDSRTILVEYMLGETGSYAWVLSPESMASFRLAPRAAIEAAASRFERLISVPPATRPPGQALAAAAAAVSELLLPPIESVPAGKRLLLVVPGALQQVPFAALRTRGGSGPLLLERNQIVSAPSASVAAALRVAGAVPHAARRTLAIFADPVFDAGDPRVSSPHAESHASGAGPAGAESIAPRGPAPLDRVHLAFARLPFTRLEADSIAAFAPHESVMEAVGFAANLRAATDRSLSHYRILHFATHGVLDTRTPELSGLVLSLVDQAGRSQDGFLRLVDLQALHLNSDLVVLSGCETALGRSVDGEGVVGLTRGFILAGSRQVAASLWKVDDLASAELMKTFYHEMLVRKTSAPRALQTAQRQMAASDRWRDPFFWAGLVLQGDWR